MWKTLRQEFHNEEEGSILESDQSMRLRFEIDRKETRSRLVLDNGEDIRWTDRIFLDRKRLFHPYDISLRRYD